MKPIQFSKYLKFQIQTNAVLKLCITNDNWYHLAVCNILQCIKRQHNANKWIIQWTNAVLAFNINISLLFYQFGENVK